jgi:hypothetical protein
MFKVSQRDSPFLASKQERNLLSFDREDDITGKFLAAPSPQSAT